jgi:nitrite reductase/ring-hydroxylating ferredoxin subunit
MSEGFDDAIERLMADRSPRAEAGNLDTDEQRMVRMAQLLRGTRPGEIDPAFAADLHARLFERPRKVSRRTAFLSGVGALAAGLIAGIGIDRSTREPGSESALPHGPMVGSSGRWVAVAQVGDVPHGAVRAFSTGAVQGFLIHDRTGLRAVSRICTHMGCALNFSRSSQRLVCPCHGAEFDMQGRYAGDPYYPYPNGLPTLPALRVRVNGESVEVWGV